MENMFLYNSNKRGYLESVIGFIYSTFWTSFWDEF